MGLLAAGLYSCSILFIALLLCLVGPHLHCDHLLGTEETGCLRFRSFVTCMMSIIVGLLFPFPLVSSLGYVM